MEDIVNKFEIWFWNGQYYVKIKFPDGCIQEIKSDTDLTYVQWKEKIEKAWADSQIPEPPPECLCSQCEVDEKDCPRLKTFEEPK